jgi:hypothetical protein
LKVEALFASAETRLDLRRKCSAVPHQHLHSAGGTAERRGKAISPTGASEGIGRLHVLEQYLDDRMERTVLSAADSMWLGYSKFYGMSGVLVLAVRHDLPCIFTREGIIGYLGRKFAVGPAMDPDNIQTVVEALRSLTMKPQQYSRSLAQAKQSFAVHSIEYFRSVISETAISAIPS